MKRVREKMKLHNKLPIGLTLALATLLMTIALVNAQPRPIGTTLQSNPFDSNPSVVDDPDFLVVGAASMYDGRLTTMGYFFLGDFDLPGYVELNTFDTKAFTIGWVDIKMKYMVEPYAIDDTYNITYSTDGVTWIALQPDTSDQFDSTTTFPEAQVRCWAEVSEPNDGTWSWTDITNLRVRVSFDPGPDGYSDLNTMYLYEVWASVYEPPLPPAASTAISIQPPVVETLAAGRRLFVEVYVQDVSSLAGYQFTINFNTTVLSPLAGGWSYYPFTDEAAADLNDPLGYVSMSYTIPISDGLSSTGVTGNLSICRIYFRVDSGMTASDYSFLTFSVSLLGDPTAGRIAHGEYHGLYGTPPATKHMFGWIPTSEFPYDAPISTHWVELWPEPGREWHLSSWEENTDGRLGPSDQIDMTMEEPPTGAVWWFHVDETWESNADPDIKVYMICTFKYEEPIPEFPLGLGLMMALAPAIPIVYLWRTRKKVVAK